MIRCPTCKGRIDTALDRCMRCDMDLSCLIQIEKAYKAACNMSIRSLLSFDIKQAQIHARHAAHLKNTAMAQALCLFAQHLEMQSLPRTNKNQ